MKHTIYKITAASALAFAFICAGQTVLGQADGQKAMTDASPSSKIDQNGMRPEAASQGDKSYDKTSDNAAQEATSQGDKSYENAGDKPAQEATSQGDKSYDKTSDGSAQEAASQDDKSYDKTSERAAQELPSQGDKSYGNSNDIPTAGANQSKDAATGNRDAMVQGVQQTDRSEASQGQSPTFVVQGNQANHYDGRWSSADSHSDWDQQTDHQWNNHDYRWYDGGWLIIDSSSAPGYGTTGSVQSNVQTVLARQGYYNGPIDGYVGRGTRSAISHYESDKGMQVNGRIDGPLLVSLGLQ